MVLRGSVTLAEGIPELLACQRGHCLERRQQAIELVVEIAVERAARDSREPQDVGYPDSLVAVLGDDRHGRPVYPLALIELDRRRVDSRPGPQLPRTQLASRPPGGRRTLQRRFFDNGGDHYWSGHTRN
jgi:hypothetical protein